MIPAPIDLLVGVDLYLEITTGKKSSSPAIVQSTLPWLVGGGRNKALRISHNRDNIK